MSAPLRIILSGMISGDLHQGGAAWAVLQYAIGLKELGHDVLLIEPIASRSIRPDAAPLQQSTNARLFRDITHRFGLSGRASMYCETTGETAGTAYGDLRKFAADCDVLLNISGMLTDPALLDPIPCRVYLDLDPAFNQMWHACEGIDMRFDAHTHFATVGQSIGSPDCDVPVCGRSWIATLPPVVLSHWPVMPLPARPFEWTTVGNWRAYGSIHHNGVLYGQKAHAVRPLMELPRRISERLQVALTIADAEVNDLEALRANEWHLVDPHDAAGTPDRYRRFIQSSRGEFGVAKSGYIVSNCGWFSDRSACYLASGRPVVAQDTGFSRHLPTGEGLLAFSGVDDAAAAINTVAADYEFHARRAREIAGDCFRSEIVLERLLERLGRLKPAPTSECGDGSYVGAGFSRPTH
jgi:hypothetical protein